MEDHMQRQRNSDTRPKPACPICDGKGTIVHIDKGKITCPRCGGSGKA
jgi:DnaJ-class molecular chaperone